MKNNEIKEILCFGDSLTWGWNPFDRGRYPFEKRWTGVLQKELGKDYRIIEEGLNGRTTNGMTQLKEKRTVKNTSFPAWNHTCLWILLLSCWEQTTSN